MIPKIIHYCWFGRNPLPASAQKCIASWRNFMPGYEIKEWNEDNFDVNIIPYTQRAYEAKKYAFVSDYARYWILYHYGGIYFDTDVEIIKPLDEIIERGPFMGIEKGAIYNHLPMVNPGLGIGAESQHPFYEKMLEKYYDHPFLLSNGVRNPDAVVKMTTIELQSRGLSISNMVQNVCNIWIYPSDYFCPMDSTTGVLSITERTVSIHHFVGSWMNQDFLYFFRHKLKIILVKLFGNKIVVRLSKILTI